MVTVRFEAQQRTVGSTMAGTDEGVLVQRLAIGIQPSQDDDAHQRMQIYVDEPRVASGGGRHLDVGDLKQRLLEREQSQPQRVDAGNDHWPLQAQAASIVRKGPLLVASAANRPRNEFRDKLFHGRLGRLHARGEWMPGVDFDDQPPRTSIELDGRDRQERSFVHKGEAKPAVGRLAADLEGAVAFDIVEEIFGMHPFEHAVVVVPLDLHHDLRHSRDRAAALDEASGDDHRVGTQHERANVHDALRRHSPTPSCPCPWTRHPTADAQLNCFVPPTRNQH
jgi:hypothetical protein